MHVQIVAEGIHQAFVLGQVRHDPQFDLRIVRRQQFVALWRDERLTDAPAFRGAHRDILQVWIARGQTPGRCHSLVIRGVDTPGARIDLLRQAIGVGAFQLAHRPVLHQHLRQAVIVFSELR
ncbi:hypothetical protein D3C72_1562000 [compost metagenome]